MSDFSALKHSTMLFSTFIPQILEDLTAVLGTMLGVTNTTVIKKAKNLSLSKTYSMENCSASLY